MSNPLSPEEEIEVFYFRAHGWEDYIPQTKAGRHAKVLITRLDRQEKEINALRLALADASNLREENAELNALFDMQYTRMAEAAKLWQEATGRHGIHPDLGELLSWLLRRNQRMQEAIKHTLTVTELPERWGRFLNNEDRIILRQALKEENG